MKTLLLIILMTVSFNSISQVEFTEEKVFQTPLMYSSLTRIVTNGDTTYTYVNRNQSYQYQSVVVTAELTFTKDELRKFAEVSLDAIDNKKNLSFMGLTFKRSVAKTVWITGNAFEIQIKYKDLKKILEETK